MSIKIETLDNKKGCLIEGNIFKATDKSGKSYKYRYEGIDPTQENGYCIHLHNLDSDTETYVEKEWFRQRKIVIF